MEHGEGPEFLLILPGKVVSRNLTYAALKEGIPSTRFRTTTLTDLAIEILDPHWLKGIRVISSSELYALIVETVSQDESGKLSFLRSLPIENEDVKSALAEEFNEYLRCCDGTSLHGHLVKRILELKDPFEKENTIQCVEAFRVLENSLLKRIALLGTSTFLSRSHLLSKARESLPISWPKSLDKIKEILVASISVFDAGALRFIANLAELGSSKEYHFHVRIFQGGGTYDWLTTRLSNAGIAFMKDGKRELPRSSSAATALEGRGAETPAFVAAPERRREVEATARAIHELLLQGARPSEILLVARNSGKYLDLVNEILPAYGISCYVQTRRPYSQLCSFRLTKSALDLIVKISESDELDWNDLTDPLRLGFCLPGATMNWPLEARIFTYLEESLSLIQHTMKGRKSPRKLSDWKNLLNEKLRWWNAKYLFTKFLNWAQKHADNLPRTPHAAKQFVSNVIGTYMYDQSIWKRELSSPRVQQPGRFVIADLHPTWFATRIRGELGEFESCLEDCMRTMGAKMSWRLISDAFSDVFSAKTYGLPEQDATAVKMVDAGNTSFLKCKHLFLMDLASNEFPRDCPKGLFLLEHLRKALYEPGTGEAAFLYLRGPRSDYDNELDFLELSLKTCDEKLTCSMSYLDEEGHAREWSAFVDGLQRIGKDNIRILPGDWLPSPKNGNWMQVAKESPPWVRQRLFCYHANRIRSPDSQTIDKREIEEIGSTLDPSFYSKMLRARIERYTNPPRDIMISHIEPWFATCSLANIIGSPLRAHEMDLHSMCPFQFYFYQFLYLWNSDRINRDDIPTYSKLPHWRLGRLPRRLSYVYPSNWTDEAIESALKVWPNRQEKLESVTNLRELNLTLSSVLTEFDRTRLGQIIEDEYHLVRQEHRDNIKRQWNWVRNGTRMKVSLEGQVQAEIVIPSHRVDKLQGCSLILVHVNFSHQLDGLVYKKTRKGADYTLEDLDESLKDYRLPLLLVNYAKKEQIAGGVYVELFDGERRGYYNHPLLSKHKGNSGYAEELRVPFNRFPESLAQVLKQHEWNTFLGRLENAITHRVKVMLPSPDIVFSASPSEFACQKCVYDTLCQIPRAEGF
jgi:ATP-dependent helicase/nuclease subunit B